MSKKSISYSISGRGKREEVSIFEFLRNHFGNIPLGQIDGVFGFLERTTLYGGRIFVRPQISQRDVMLMRLAGVGLRIPLTNHFVDKDEYSANYGFLEKYHFPGNSLIITNDDLARWVKVDFPYYKIEASLLKEIKTYKEIEKALSLYDMIILPMELCEDHEFLMNIEAKSRIRLFANAGCALTCKARICYRSISRINKGSNQTLKCSRPKGRWEDRGMVDFDIDRLIECGFSKFKLLRARPGGHTGF